MWVLAACHAYHNRKEGNDQESIQLPNTFRQRYQRERRTHLKQRHHNQNTASRKAKGQFLFLFYLFIFFFCFLLLFFFFFFVLFFVFFLGVFLFLFFFFFFFKKKKKKKGQTAIQNKKFARTFQYMQIQIMTEIVNHSRSTALEWSVKTLLGVRVGGVVIWKQSAKLCRDKNPDNSLIYFFYFFISVYFFLFYFLLYFFLYGMCEKGYYAICEQRWPWSVCARSLIRAFSVCQYSTIL